MKRQSILVLAVVCVAAMASIASADTFGTGSNQFIIDFVNISGDASSANGTAIGSGKTFSDPSNDYRMGTYEITNAQWNKFVNSYGTVTGSPSNGYGESAYWTGADVPTNKVSWYATAQFVNYLNTSTGHQAAYKFTGTQGQSDYTLDIWSVAEAAGGTNLYRHKDAMYFLPTEDEWVKAAYWNGTDLQIYATTDGSMPTVGVDANYDQSHPRSGPWDVGTGTMELNGTFDMMGNIKEWMESPYNSGDYLPGSFRGQRGSSYEYIESYLRSSLRTGGYPHDQIFVNDLGFRVASVSEPAVIPVPGAVLLGTLGLSVAGWKLRRREKS